jgi:tRNA A37 threonylcarbamoyltransferase TsaD
MKLNTAAVGRLLKSEAVKRDLQARADRIAAAAGPGMDSTVVEGTNRARAFVTTGTFKARFAEATTRRLTRAIDAGR